MKEFILISVATLMFSVNGFANDNGKELFTQKCEICHKLSFPKNKANMVAPPAPGVMFHMHQKFNSDEEILAYMRNFVMNPTKKTSLKKETRRFGLMPSQKGNVTPQELKTITSWMLENIHMNKKQHKQREKQYKMQ
ncbi:MAG: cytochrome c [Epsilonproteobacteria bacterium]|nr:cytochrome c [Campylobacterota bacterium]